MSPSPTAAALPALDAAFEAFVADGSPRLLRSAYLITGDRAQAEDLLQTALVRVARHWEAAGAAPHAYAHRVLINLVHDRHRALRRRVHESPLSDAAELVDPRGDRSGDVLDRLAIIAAVRDLPARQREVVVLRFYADLSVQETAAAIGASEGTVKTHTSRALETLRRALGDGGEAHAD